jgi:multidrug efflux pump subunit AcrB
MISDIFIDRPRLAFVVSIVITLAGILAIPAIPVAQFPRYRAASGLADHALSGRRRQLPLR